MVWTPDQIGAFLDVAVDSRLYALYQLLLVRGLRRGEGVGADWDNVHLDAGEFTVLREIIVGGWTPIEEDPKAEESAATIALGSLTVAVLREHKERQPAEREKAGTAWTETGKVFTDELGGRPHLFKEVDRALAEKAAVLVPRARGSLPESRRDGCSRVAQTADAPRGPPGLGRW
jgi:integrase